MWVEWRKSVNEALSQTKYRETIEERMQRLACILSAPDKPKHFPSPKCLGCFRSQQSDRPQFALVYEWPASSDQQDQEFISLRDLLASGKRAPTLNYRLAVAKALSGCLLYHAVNWIHKDVRSDSVPFPTSLNRQIVVRFYSFWLRFSRPAVPEAVTVSLRFSAQYDLYRHSDLLMVEPGRSKKSHDIYSSGLVPAEIALWLPVETIAEIEVRRSQLGLVRPRMSHYMSDVPGAIAERAGWACSDVVKDCIEGRQALGVRSGAEEEDPEIAAVLSNALHDKVVRKLQAIKV